MNNVGGRRLNTPTEDLALEDWQRILDLNLTQAFVCTKRIGGAMLPRKWGRIINISSSSVLVGNARRIHYVASKMGVLGFTRSLAAALGDYNICVNSIMPGAVMDESTIAAYGREWYEKAPLTRPLKRIQVRSEERRVGKECRL